MGSTYETDEVDKHDEIELALHAAMIGKSLGNFVACRLWLVARLALRELRQRVDELAKLVEAGSK